MNLMFIRLWVVKGYREKEARSIDKRSSMIMGPEEAFRFKFVVC